MNKKPAVPVTAVLVALFVLVALVLTLWFTVLAPRLGDGGGETSGEAVVERVVDGDTMEVRYQGRKERVRFLNIDTPETKHPTLPVQCLGPEASAYTKKVLPAGTRVRLDFDRQQRDEHGRLIAGVFLGDRLINEELVLRGLAVPVKFKPNYKYFDRMQAAEAVAENSQVGLFDPSIECTLVAQLKHPETASEVMPLVKEVAEQRKGSVREDLINELGEHGVSIYSRPSLRNYVGKTVTEMSDKIPSDRLQDDPDQNGDSSKQHDPRRPDKPRIQEKPEKIYERPVERPTDKN